MYDQEAYEMIERVMREGFKLLLDHGTYRLRVAVRAGSIG